MAFMQPSSVRLGKWCNHEVEERTWIMRPMIPYGFHIETDHFHRLSFAIAFARVTDLTLVSVALYFSYTAV